jgi:hypothetical protein
LKVPNPTLTDLKKPNKYFCLSGSSIYPRLSSNSISADTIGLYFHNLDLKVFIFLDPSKPKRRLNISALGFRVF